MRNYTLNKYYKTLMVSCMAAFVGACASTNGPSSSVSESAVDELEQRKAALLERENALLERESKLYEYEASQSESSVEDASSSYSATADTLLPPNAAPGECYARVWVPPTYKTEELTVKVKDESEKISLVPAKYQTIEKEVLVKEASSYRESIPAVYGTETETIQISEERTVWRKSLDKNSSPVSEKLLAAATAAGIDLDRTAPGTCYHEHYIPAKYETVTEEVLVKEASNAIETTDAKYEWVEEQILVSEASSRIEQVPAVFVTETEEVIDVPAHTIWKKGRGPIQRIDEATGEIMCLVDVPATYKTVSKRVLKTPATTRTIEIPAEYKAIKVRKLVSEPGEISREIPAEYKTVNRTKLVSAEQFVWHEIHNKDYPTSTRTGAQICLTKEPAQHRTIKRTVVKQPASSRTVEVPAEYKTIKVRELVAEASEQRTTIPAEYKTVTQQKIITDGHMQWRSILCETNMTRSKITQIQRALSNKGYDVGPIDGVIGRQTISAVNAFQTDNNLPTDRYLNIETVQALGVSPK